MPESDIKMLALESRIGQCLNAKGARFRAPRAFWVVLDLDRASPPAAPFPYVGLDCFPDTQPAAQIFPYGNDFAVVLAIGFHWFTLSPRPYAPASMGIAQGKAVTARIIRASCDCKRPYLAPARPRSGLAWIIHRFYESCGLIGDNYR